MPADSRKIVPVPPRDGSQDAAQVAGDGAISQDQAQALSDAVAKEVVQLVDRIQKIALVAQKLNAKDEQLQGILASGDQLVASIQDALGIDMGGKKEEQPSPQGPVPQESGGRGIPA